MGDLLLKILRALPSGLLRFNVLPHKLLDTLPLSVFDLKVEKLKNENIMNFTSRPRQITQNKF